MSDLDHKCTEVVAKLRTFMQSNTATIQTHSTKLKMFTDKLLIERTRTRFNQIFIRQILFKSILQTRSPSSWESCVAFVDMSPKMCISAYLGQVLSSQCLLELHCGDQVEKVMESPTARIVGPLLEKLEVIGAGVLGEIESVYFSARSYISKFQLNTSSVVRKSQKGYYSEHFARVKRCEADKLLLEMTCPLLYEILDKLKNSNNNNNKINNNNDDDNNNNPNENNGDVTTKLTNYRVSLLKIHKSSQLLITKEAEEEVKLKVLEVLNNFKSTCKSFIHDEHMIAHTSIDDVICDTSEMLTKVFELGKMLKSWEDRSSHFSSLERVNLQLLCDLLPLDVISKEKVDPSLRSMLCLCRQDLGDDGVLNVLRNGGWNMGRLVTR